MQAAGADANPPPCPQVRPQLGKTSPAEFHRESARLSRDSQRVVSGTHGNGAERRSSGYVTDHTNAPTIAEGTRLADRYELIEQLGRGGAGDVWLAWDDTLHRQVAVKVLRDTDAEMESRFSAEIRAQSPLTHPSIVRLFDAGRHGPNSFLVMAYLEGQALSDLLDSGPLPPEDAGRLGRQLADALAHAHAAGVVHRDVKPSNVLVDGDGNAHLTDFGIARLADSERLTATGSFVGSAGYVAPEQVRGEEVDAAADVYALGLVLLEALTGQQEYTGPAIEAAVARLHRPPQVPDDLPEPWPELLWAMLASDAPDRPEAAAVAARLGGSDWSSRTTAATGAADRTEQLSTGPTVYEAPTEPWAEPEATETVEEADRSPAEPPRRRWVWVAAAAALAAAALAAVLAIPPGPEKEPTPEEPESLEEALDQLEETIEP